MLKVPSLRGAMTVTRGGVERDEVGADAAGDDDHVAAQLRADAEVDLLEHIERGADGLAVGSRNLEHAGLSGADAEEERLEALRAKLVERDVAADLHAGFELYAHLAQHVDLGVQHVLLQAEGRDGEGGHAAEHLLLFKDRDGIALLAQIVRAA